MMTAAAFDVVVVGAGAVGLSAGIALARSGLDVAVAGPVETRATGRTVALLDGSVLFYRALGLWDDLAPLAAPLAVMRLVDDTGSLFRPPPAAFHAREIGLEAFGQNIENHRLVESLLAAARRTPGVRHFGSRVVGVRLGKADANVTLETGEQLPASILVAADGRRSLVRAAAGIGVRETRYGQSALTAILSHARPHDDASTEFHTRGGPFTLVPLLGTEAAPHRSSLVWMMPEREADRRRQLDDATFAREVEAHAHSMLGAMSVAGARGRFPIASATAVRLTGQRVALVGEAAHVMPPIGAQGLNLGLRDVAHLVDCFADAAGRLEDPGSAETLAAYARARRFDIASRTAGVAALNRSLLTGLLPVDFLRGAGLAALSSIGPLRRIVMREGVMPAGPRPRLMRKAVVLNPLPNALPLPRRNPLPQVAAAPALARRSGVAGHADRHR